MEKYTSEAMAGMSHEELENIVSSLQSKMDETEKNRKMYQDWVNDETKRREVAEKRLDAIKVMLSTWG